MKIIALIIVLITSPVLAKTYKCDVNGKTTYQAKPCPSGGGEIKLNSTYVHEEDRLAADRRISNYLYVKAEEKRIKAEIRERERLIRVEEDKAYAIEENMRANKEQVEQTKKLIKAVKRIDNTVIIY